MIWTGSCSKRRPASNSPPDVSVVTFSTSTVELPVDRRQPEQLVLGGVDARAVDVADLARGREREQRLDRRARRRSARRTWCRPSRPCRRRQRQSRRRARRRSPGPPWSWAWRPRSKDWRPVVLRAALEVDGALLADGHQLDVEAHAHQLLDARLGLLDREVVVPAAQPAVARDADHEDRLDGADLHERRVDVLDARASG